MALKWKDPHVTIQGNDPNNFAMRIEFYIRDDAMLGKLGGSKHDEGAGTIGAEDWPLTKATLRAKVLAAIEAAYPGAVQE